MEGIEEIEQLEKERDEISKRLNKAHKKYGVWIRLQREYSEVSLRDFAKKIGISAPYLSDIERGNRHVSKHVRDAISKAIDDCRTLLIEESRKTVKDMILNEMQPSEERIRQAAAEAAEDQNKMLEEARKITEV